MLRKTFMVGILKALFKGFSVAYLLLLPILYSQDLISAAAVGYIGAVLIIGSVAASLFLSLRPHTFGRKSLVNGALFAITLVTFLVLLDQHESTLFLVFFVVGVCIALGGIVTDELMTSITQKGDRYSTFANVAVMMDLMRIVYPIVIGGLFTLFFVKGILGFILVVALLSFVLVNIFISKVSVLDRSANANNTTTALKHPFRFLRDNRSFGFVMAVEFMDSLTGSQLFVFLPTLLILKDFSIESALLIQSIFFFGYLCGRLLVSKFANKWGGLSAVGLAEVGMSIVILSLVVVPASVVLYPLCFLLGVFTRGTSPVIKATAFDQLDEHEVRQGAAIHGISGDTGSSLGQFLFGLLLAGFGANAPFLFAAAGTGLVAIACFVYVLQKPLKA